MSSRPARSVRLAAYACAALILTIGRASGQGSGGMPVRIDAVREEQVQKRAVVTGELHARRSAQVAAQEAGLVVAVLAREGARVASGDVLARLDDERLRRECEAQVAAREAAAAEQHEADILLAQARRDLAALEDLEKRGAAHPKELGDARSAVQVAGARLARATARFTESKVRIALLDRRLADLEIRAPFAGQVIALEAEVGEWIAAGGTAVELVSTGELEAWLDVPADYRSALLRELAGVDGGGAGAAVPASAGEGGAARSAPAGISLEVSGVAGDLRILGCRWIDLVDSTSRGFPLILDVSSPLLAAGMAARAWVPTGGAERHLTVHKDAILRRGTGPFIFVARQAAPGGPVQAMPVPVRVLFPVGDRVAVEAAGLAAGAHAVVEGNERLFPMMPVTVVEVPGAASASAGDSAQPGGSAATGGRQGGGQR